MRCQDEDWSDGRQRGTRARHKTDVRSCQGRRGGAQGQGNTHTHIPCAVQEAENGT